MRQNEPEREALMTRIKKPACFRELGGISCADGKKVVQGILYRSGHLGKLNMKAADALGQSCGIAHIVDLRSNSEVRDVPDIVGSRMTYHRFTPLDDERNPSVTRKTRLKILKRLMAKDGGTRKHLCDTYRGLVTLPDSLNAYRSLIELLLDGKGGVLWHCTQGKDRTGMGSAVILMALGAEKETIIKDYLLYNSYCSFKNSIIFIAVTMLKFSTFMAKSLNNLMTAQEDYIAAAFDEIEKCYGGVEGFLKKGLLLDNEKLLKLRSMYLV